MTIEPSQAHTVYIRAVMPPKPEERVLKPKLSIEADAKLIGKRFHKTFGATSNPMARVNTNKARIANAKRLRAETANRIAALLGNGAGMTAPALQVHFTVSQNHIRTVLKEMAKAGRVTKAKGARGICLWALAEGETE